MERAVLQSTTLASAVYHAALRRLEIEFRTGTRYLYFRVPPECYREFLDAESKGLTSTATSATASPTNTCPMRPAPLSSPPVTKLSDIGHDCRPHPEIGGGIAEPRPKQADFGLFSPAG